MKTGNKDEIKELMIDKNSNLGGLHYVRIGEDGTDFEETYSGGVWKQINLTRYSEFDEVENKKELK